MSNKETKVFHTIAPIYNKDSKILILGSMPSVKSREDNFYYAHPKNRFWKIIKELFKEINLETIEDKKEFLLKNNIALYDVIKSCTISSSSDSSIKNVEVNDIKSIVDMTNITKIFTTGKTAYNLYNKYLKDTVKIEAICLPSTSPANAKASFKYLLEEYSVIKEYLK